MRRRSFIAAGQSLFGLIGLAARAQSSDPTACTANPAWIKDALASAAEDDRTYANLRYELVKRLGGDSLLQPFADAVARRAIRASQQ